MQILIFFKKNYLKYKLNQIYSNFANLPLGVQFQLEISINKWIMKKYLLQETNLETIMLI